MFQGLLYYYLARAWFALISFVLGLGAGCFGQYTSSVQLYVYLDLS